MPSNRGSAQILLFISLAAPCTQFTLPPAVMARPRTCFPMALKAEFGDGAKDTGVISTREVNEEEGTGKKWMPLASETKAKEKLDTAPFAAWFSESAASLSHSVDADKIRIGEAWGDTSTPEPSWNGFCGRGTRSRPPWWPERKQLSGWRKTPRTSHVWGEVVFDVEEEVALQSESNGAHNSAAEVSFEIARRTSEHSAHAWRNAPRAGEVRLVTFDKLWDQLEDEDTSLPLYGNRQLFDLSSLKEEWGDDDVLE